MRRKAISPLSEGNDNDALASFVAVNGFAIAGKRQKADGLYKQSALNVQRIGKLLPGDKSACGALLSPLESGKRRYASLLPHSKIFPQNLLKKPMGVV